MTATRNTDPVYSSLAGCGQRLRTAREAAGLSIDDVAARLHMPTRVVRSLEAEDWAQLGAPVFVRGQVRSYLRLLGLATAPMLDALGAGDVEPPPLVSRSHIPPSRWWAEQIGRRLVYIVLTLSLVIPAWVATQQHFMGPAATGATAALDVPAGNAATEAAARTGAAAPRTVVASMAPVSSPMTPAAETATVKAAGIVLRASGPSWLEVIADDGSVLAKELLTAGAERRYPISRVRRMTIGNAAAVTLENDGVPVDVAAHARANVARFEVSSDGTLVAAN